MSAPLAQSADKQVLFARLGLDDSTHKLLLVRSYGSRQIKAKSYRLRLRMRETNLAAIRRTVDCHT